MPQLYILAGPNGSGKSSAGSNFLPENIRQRYIPFDGDKLKMIKQVEFKKQLGSYKEAGKLADEFVYDEFERLYKNALKSKDHFVYEGHFTEESSWGLIKIFKDSGYQINMIYMGLVSLELSESRVFHRAKTGGHNVPPYEIHNNFYKNLQQLNTHLFLIDHLLILDTSTTNPQPILERFEGQLSLYLLDADIPEWLKKNVPLLF